MYTFAVCDDEPAMACLVADKIHAYYKEKHVQISVNCFSNPKNLQSSLLKKNCYDVLLMDIDMPGIDGIELCRNFRQNGGDSLIVFISNKEELVFQTFDVQPFRFVRKRRLNEELENLCRALTSELEKRMDVRLRFDNEVDGSVLSLSINKLIYIEARGKFCMLKTTEGEDEIRIQFQELQDKLAQFSFMQPHRSYLVNPRFIYRIGKDEILLDGGEQLPISRRRREKIKEAYFRWSRAE